MTQKKIPILYDLGFTNDSNYDFKEKTPIEQRIKTRENINKQYPDLQMIICEPHKSLIKVEGEKAYPKNSKLLMSPNDALINLKNKLSQLIQFKITKTDSFWIFCNNTLLIDNQLMGELQTKYADSSDNILYLKYATQDTFGMD